MDKTSHCFKTQRTDYNQTKVKCIICKKIKKKKSKSFSSLYSLKFHLTTEHNREDEIVSGITKKEVLHTSRAIAKAVDWNMLIDLPQRKTI